MTKAFAFIFAILICAPTMECIVNMIFDEATILVEATMGEGENEDPTTIDSEEIEKQYNVEYKPTVALHTMYPLQSHTFISPNLLAEAYDKELSIPPEL